MLLWKTGGGFTHRERGEKLTERRRKLTKGQDKKKKKTLNLYFSQGSRRPHLLCFFGLPKTGRPLLSFAKTWEKPSFLLPLPDQDSPSQLFFLCFSSPKPFPCFVIFAPKAGRAPPLAVVLPRGQDNTAAHWHRRPAPQPFLSSSDRTRRQPPLSSSQSSLGLTMQQRLLHRSFSGHRPTVFTIGHSGAIPLSAEAPSPDLTLPAGSHRERRLEACRPSSSPRPEPAASGCTDATWTHSPAVPWSHRRPPETERKGKRKEKWFAERSRSENSERKSWNRLACCIFGCFAGNGAAHSWQEGEEGRKPWRISPRLWISRWRVNPRAASWGGAWRRRAATAPQFLRASSAVPGLFRDLFVIVTCLNMYLNFS